MILNLIDKFAAGKYGSWFGLLSRLTLGGVLLINSIKARVAALLTEAGQPPTVLSAANVVGEKEAVRLFESAYDQHAVRLTQLYQF